MNTDYQLTRVTNQWFVMLLVTFAVGSGFYLCPKIVVDQLIPLEFSQTLAKFHANVSNSLDTIRFNTTYDFLFIVVYSILFYYTYRVFQSSMRIATSKLWVVLCILPGCFDIIENLTLLGLLDHTQNKWLFRVFWLAVRAKWTLVLPFFIINFTILVYYIIRWVNSFFR